MASNLDFVGTCVQLSPRLLEEYDDTSRTVVYNTFRRHMGRERLQALNLQLGYTASNLSLATDSCVTYSMGKWRGKPAICMMHSAIHHIWTIR